MRKTRQRRIPRQKSAREPKQETAYQRIIWPWEKQKWPEIKRKITAEISSIIELDGRIASLSLRGVRPKQISSLFDMYYSDDQYKSHQVSQEVLLGEIIPQMQKLIEIAPRTFKGFSSRVLVPGPTSNITLNRVQVATIISCMWFGLFNYNYVSRGEHKLEDFPEASFTNIFTNNNIFALQCVLNYFCRVAEYMNSEDKNTRDTFAAGNIIIKRNQVAKFPNWAELDKPIEEICIGDGFVDDSPVKMHTAYSHEIIGGELFRASINQEQIVLLTKPECLVSLLFCSELKDSDAIVIFGAEKMSQYAGFGTNVRFMGNFVDETPRGYSANNTEVMMQKAVVFIDANPTTSGVGQFIQYFNRDLNKAYAGFSSMMFSSEGERVASGHWTYGFNGNNMQLKFIQQALAASATSKSLVYYPPNKDFEIHLEQFIEWIAINEITVGELYASYIELIKDSYTGPYSRLNELDVFSCLMDYI